MALKIVWTEKANIERQQILQFWIDHTIWDGRRDPGSLKVR